MSNITLHAATEEVRALLDQIDPETGELSPEYENARALVERKAVAVVAYILETERQADYIAAYAKELAARAKAAQKRTDWLRAYLGEHMAACGISSIKDERGLFAATLAVGRDVAVEVFDADQLPAEYMRTKITHEPDKSALRPALEAGDVVPGAKLVRRNRLTVK
jgi:hypothetical protein